MIRSNNILIIFIFLLLASSCTNKNTEGKTLYESQCMNCHQEGGKGVGRLIPPISKSFLISNHNQIPCIIKKGINGKLLIDGVEYNHEMPGNIKISDFDLVNILNYIEEEFGSGNKEIYNIENVRKSLRDCK